MENNIECAIQRVKAGEVQVFSLIVEEFQQGLFKYCFHMLGNMSEAEEVVQEVFVKAYEKIHKYNNNTSFSAWIYKIAYNHSINILRRKRLLQFIPLLEENALEDKGVEMPAYPCEINEELNKALSKLNFQDRSVILLRALEEKSYEEISIILNITSASARKKYERSKKKLKEYLEDKGGNKNDGYAING